MPKEWKPKLIQGAASVAVAHSVGYGASRQDALSGAIAVMSALIRGLMLQGGTGVGRGVAMQTGSASEKMTNNALSLMIFGFGEPGMKLRNCGKASYIQGYL